MDNFVVPFVDVMLGSFVFVVGLLFVLGYVDEMKQRRGRRLYPQASAPSWKGAREAAKRVSVAPARRRGQPAEAAEQAKAA
jgi:hypothetical protein